MTTAGDTTIVELDNGLCISLQDQSSHYFGGYYRVRVVAFCEVPIKRSFFADDSEFEDALGRLGDFIRFERSLEKMAVPECETGSIRKMLIEQFLSTSIQYLSAADFAQRFVLSELDRSRKIMQPRFNLV